MKIVCLVCLSLTASAVGFCNPAFAQPGAGAAHDEIQAAITAMGGEQVLDSVHSLEFSAVGHRNMLEQSLRPDGPWWQDYFQLDEIRDFATRSERVNQRHRGYSSPDWWLQDKSWDGSPDNPTYVVSGDVVATDIKGQFAPFSNRYLQAAREDFAFGPVPLLHTALAAPDLHVEPDAMFHGFRHQVVAFTVTAALNRFLTPSTASAAAASAPANDPPKLAAELQPLAFFEGRWHCAGKFVQSGKPIHSDEMFAPDLDGRWLAMRHDDQPPFPFHALEMWDYDKTAKQFTAYIFDNFSGIRHFVSPGWAGEGLTWTNAAAMHGATDRFVFEKRDDAGYQVTYYLTRDGKKWSPVDSLRCRRTA